MAAIVFLSHSFTDGGATGRGDLPDTLVGRLN